MSVRLVTELFKDKTLITFDGYATILECVDLNDEHAKATFKIKDATNLISHYIISYSQAKDLIK